MHLQLAVAVRERPHQHRIVKILRRLPIDRHNRQPAKIFPVRQLRRGQGSDVFLRALVRLCQHMRRKGVRNGMFPDDDFNIHPKCIRRPQNLDHPSLRRPPRLRKPGDFYLDSHSLQRLAGLRVLWLPSTTVEAAGCLPAQSTVMRLLLGFHPLGSRRNLDRPTHTIIPGLHKIPGHLLKSGTVTPVPPHLALRPSSRVVKDSHNRGVKAR